MDCLRYVATGLQQCCRYNDSYEVTSEPADLTHEVSKKSFKNRTPTYAESFLKGLEITLMPSNAMMPIFTEAQRSKMM